MGIKMLVGAGLQDGIKNSGGLWNSRDYARPSFIYLVLKQRLLVAEIELLE